MIFHSLEEQLLDDLNNIIKLYCEKKFSSSGYIKKLSVFPKKAIKLLAENIKQFDISQLKIQEVKQFNDAFVKSIEMEFEDNLKNACKFKIAPLIIQKYKNKLMSQLQLQFAK